MVSYARLMLTAHADAGFRAAVPSRVEISSLTQEGSFVLPKAVVIPAIRPMSAGWRRFSRSFRPHRIAPGLVRFPGTLHFQVSE